MCMLSCEFEQLTPKPAMEYLRWHSPRISKDNLTCTSVGRKEIGKLDFLNRNIVLHCNPWKGYVLVFENAGCNACLISPNIEYCSSTSSDPVLDIGEVLGIAEQTIS